MHMQDERSPTWTSFPGDSLGIKPEVLRDILVSFARSSALLGGRFRLVLDHRIDEDGVFHVALDEFKHRIVRPLTSSDLDAVLNDHVMLGRLCSNC